MSHEVFPARLETIKEIINLDLSFFVLGVLNSYLDFHFLFTTPSDKDEGPIIFYQDIRGISIYDGQPSIFWSFVTKAF